MGVISLQMIDNRISSHWWRKLIEHFIKAGDVLEIRCWKEEVDEIKQASLYGNTSEDKNEVSVKGVVSAELLAELLSEESSDKSIYNKMTKYFTINVENEKCFFCSAHYGTEMYIERVSEDDISFFESVINQYDDCFSVHINKQ